MIRLALSALSLALAAAAVPPASAAPTDCPDKFVGGAAPDVVNPKLLPRTQPLCFSAFAILHSGAVRTSLWSAEHLTREGVRRARETSRVNTFHADPRLPAADRSELADYARSGYDRGHLAPSGDMPDPAAQEESFSLANMIPQDPSLNRGLWEGIESAVRNMASRNGELYVVTGPIYRGSEVKALRGRVLVPTHVFKAVYDPRTGRSGAYLVANAAGTDWKGVAITELAALSGIDVFPALPASAKNAAMKLPDPTSHGFDRGVAQRNGESILGRTAEWLARKVIRSW
ncbi:hypothetical protein BHAOGJBA_1259 [Methylobacterium hispanicum]|uniref:Endonuclease n=1 Tax=Methylobacterium hispanicum TaxID=270350 RepID=A0AAV4ZH39_9HYPH|nr:DNA/RNA non-specific endonuclease [Methylobacterium hispanicum]GJD87754.1 hypothetical protein BHAOGJBA_1259 [Methylobacterium hispanicum]